MFSLSIWSVLSKGLSFGVERSTFKFQLYLILAKCPWASYLPQASFPSVKLVMIPTSVGSSEDNER